MRRASVGAPLSTLIQGDPSVRKEVSVQRVAGATAGLVVSGGIAGGVVGASLLGVLGLVVDGVGGFPHLWEMYALAAVVGAGLGGIGLPLVTWAFLRHVAFGRVLAHTAIGTAVGGTIGLLSSGLNPATAVFGALSGFVAAAVLLRFRNPKRAR